MRVEVLGAAPEPAEVAAILAALSLLEAPPEPALPAPSGWKLAMRYPDLSLDDVRALQRNRIR
jgi:hypothetical protein